MSQVSPQKFGAEFVAHLRELLEIAAEQIGPEHRTLVTQTKMAEARICNSEDITEAHHPTSATLPEGEDRTA